MKKRQNLVLEKFCKNYHIQYDRNSQGYYMIHDYIESPDVRNFMLKNKLSSLFFQNSIVDSLYLYHVGLTSLKGSPLIVNGFMNVTINNLRNLEGLPMYVKRLAVTGNNIDTLKHLKDIKYDILDFRDVNHITDLSELEHIKKSKLSESLEWGSETNSKCNNNWKVIIKRFMGLTPDADGYYRMVKKVYKENGRMFTIYESENEKPIVTRYTPGKTMQLKHYNTDITTSCSSGYHFSNGLYSFSGDTWVSCLIHKDDIITAISGKVRVRKCQVLEEVKNIPQWIQNNVT